MVAPVVVGIAAAGAVGYGIYKKGKSKGKRKKEQEIDEDAKEEIKDQLREEARKEYEKEQSKKAHKQAKNRDPPVDIGDIVDVGVKSIKAHHSDIKTAVCKKEGFVIFADGCPEDTSSGDKISVKITSYGRDQSSAEAEYLNKIE